MTEKNEKVDAMQPPPELLERYKDLGYGENLVELIKEEQEHRHKLQNRYASAYRCGQFFSAIISAFTIYKIFELILIGKETQGYIMSGVFVGLVIIVSLINRINRGIITKKRLIRNNNNNNNRNNRNNRSFGRNSNYRK